jgi:Holliday junction resolvasome RuvABC endonuclease subunit
MKNLINGIPDTICAIDASTNNLAFAIFKNKKLVYSGKLNFSGSNIFEKIGDAAKKTGNVFSHFEVQAVVIEHTVYINSPKTMSDLAMVQGALLGSAMISGAKISGSINPMTWQTFIGNGKLSAEEKTKLRLEFPGKGDSWYKTKEREVRKQKTIRFVNTYFDKNITDNDVADAVGIGHYALNNWSKIISGVSPNGK